MSQRESNRQALAAAKAGDAATLRSALDAAPDAKKAANAEDADGYTPLDHAIDGRHAAMLAPLIEAGANVHGDDAMLCALKRTAATGEADLVRELLRLVPAHEWNRDERREAVDAAVETNRPDVLDLLPTENVKKTASQEMAAFAAYLGLAGSLRWLLDQHGVSPSTVAMMGGEDATLLHHAAAGGRVAAAALLIEAGAGLDARDKRGRTPLMYAAKGEASGLSVSINDAAKLEVAREEGRLIHASAPPDPPPTDKPDTAVALLLEAGADATLKDDDGLDALAILRAEFPKPFETPIQNEEEWPLRDPRRLGKVVRRQIDADLARAIHSEANPPPDDFSLHEKLWAQEEQARRLVVLAFERMLRDAGATGRSDADAAVIAAVQANDPAALRAALDAGGSPTASILTKNGHGATTPLAWAIYREYAECFRILLDAGADPSDGGRDGPPLISAARSDKTQAVRMLLDAGADVNVREPGEDGWTALEAAQVAGRKEMVRLLRDRGAIDREPDEPFEPGVDDWYSTATELLVKANCREVADAVAKSIGGAAQHDVLGQTITIAEERGHLVVQLAGSEWSSVLMGVGSDRIPDDNWLALAADLSRLAPAALLRYENVSSVHFYHYFSDGEEVEHFVEDMNEPEFDDTGRWRSERGRRKPRDMRRGEKVLDKLARDEGFAVFLSNPGGGRGEEVEVGFPGDRRRIATASYAGR